MPDSLIQLFFPINRQGWPQGSKGYRGEKGEIYNIPWRYMMIWLVKKVYNISDLIAYDDIYFTLLRY